MINEKDTNINLMVTAIDKAIQMNSTFHQLKTLSKLQDEDKSHKEYLIQFYNDLERQNSDFWELKKDILLENYAPEDISMGSNPYGNYLNSDGKLSE